MLVKIHSTTKSIVVISVSLFLLVSADPCRASSNGGTKGGGQVAKLTTSGSSTLQQFQLNSGFSASSEPSLNYGDRISSSSSSSSTSGSTGTTAQSTQSTAAPTITTTNSGSFREALRSKSQLVLNENSNDNSLSTGQISGGSIVSSNYGGSIYQQALNQVRGIVPEEALNLDSSSENSAELNSNKVQQQTTGVQTSSEEFLSNLGTEATTEVDAGTQPSPVFQGRSQQQTRSQQIQNQIPEQIEQEHELLPSSKPAQRIQAAVKTKHTFEFRPVVLDNLQEEIAPKIIEVGAKALPLEIHFKSASSRIKLVQQHKSGELQQVERTSSSEEPQRLIHLVRKPIIQEVREIITPYRRIVQEIQPVMEEIHTIVSHEKERSKTSARQQKQTTQTQVQTTQTSTQKKAQTQQRPQNIPQNWLRPVQQNTQKIEQTRTQTQRIQSQQPQNYGPSFNTYPIEATSPAPQVDNSNTNDESSEPDNGLDQDQNVEVVNTNDLSSTIIPARLMQEIIHDYQTRNRILTVNNNQRNEQQSSNRVSLPVVSRDRVIQQQKERQIQQLRIQRDQQQTKGGQITSAASNQQWQAVRPYVFYGSQNGQFRGPFPYNSNRF